MRAAGSQAEFSHGSGALGQGSTANFVQKASTPLDALHPLKPAALWDLVSTESFEAWRLAAHAGIIQLTGLHIGTAYPTEEEVRALANSLYLARTNFQTQHSQCCCAKLTWLMMCSRIRFTRTLWNLLSLVAPKTAVQLLNYSVQDALGESFGFGFSQKVNTASVLF